MSTVAEIESAIEHLPASEMRRLLDRLSVRSVSAEISRAKTGAELAALWPARFHLPPVDAESLAADLAEARARQRAVRRSAWE